MTLRAWHVWCLGIVVLYGLVGLHGLDFPVNDDWAYAKVVAELHATGRYRLNDWCAMLLLPQVAWGWLATVGGFSFGALRWTTVLAAAVGVGLVERLLREAGAPRGAAIATALLVGFHPIVFGLANTFMTDVPFLALVVVALWCCPRSLVAFTAACVAATLERQIGLAVPLAHCLAGRQLRDGIPLAVTWVVYRAVTVLVDRTTGLPAPFNFPIGSMRATGQLLLAGDPATWSNVVHHLVIILLFLGLFTVPLAFERCRTLRTVERFVVLGTTVGLIALVRWWNLTMPMTDNIWLGRIIGPRYTIPGGGPDATLPLAVSRALDWLGAVGAAVLVVESGHGLRYGRRFLVLLLVCLVGPLCLVRFFDRYLLAALLAAVLLLAPRRAGWAVVGAAVLAVVAVTSTAEYLTWNRVRWQLLTELTHEVNVRAIDGGLEWNGWHFDDEPWVPRPGLGLYARDNAWVVSWSPLPGYTVVRSQPPLVVLRRD